MTQSTLVAAAADQGRWNLTLIAAVVALAWFAGYVIACVIWPFAACRKCDGAGKHRSPSGRAWRPCRRCKGSGARRRFGRTVYAYFRRARDEAAP